LLALKLLFFLYVRSFKFLFSNFLTNIGPTLMLQLDDLRVGQQIEPYIGLIQENSIENSVQDSLPYILKPHGPC